MTDPNFSDHDMIQIDLLLSSTVEKIRCPAMATFYDLHKVLCHTLDDDHRQSYSFFHPKLQLEIRSITRSKTVSALEPVCSYLKVGDELHYYVMEQRYRLKIRSLGKQIQQPNIKMHLLRAQLALNATMKRTVHARNMMNSSTQRIVWDICSNLFADKIYNYLLHESLLVLHVGELKKYVYIENRWDGMQLVFFTNERSCRRFQCVKKDSLPDENIDKYKDGIVLSYAKTPLPKLPYIHIRHTYVSIADHKRGYLMDQLSEAEANEMLAYLQILYYTIRKMSIFQIPFHPKSKELHVQFYLSSKKTELQVRPIYHEPIHMLPYLCDHNIKLLSKLARSEECFELDYRFVSPEDTSDKQLRYSYMIEAVCVGPSVQMKRTAEYTKEQDVADLIQDLLLDLIERKKRFSTLYVKERYVYSMVIDLCRKLEIKVRILPVLPYLKQASYIRKRSDQMIRPYR